MPSPGNRFLGGYGPFVRRFVVGYLLLCSAALLALLVADAIFPKKRVYGHVKDLVRACLPPAETTAKP
jgi:hypothetical protein